MSRDYQLLADVIDWLITKSLCLIWRSVMDHSVFQSTISGYDLFGFQNESFSTRFEFEKCLLTSIEDLYRPLSYKETHQLRLVRPGINLNFLRRQFVPDCTDRSRLRYDEVQLRFRSNRGPKPHRQQKGRHAGFDYHQKHLTPEILADNGFEIVPVENGYDGNFQMVHNLGLSFDSCSFVIDFVIDFVIICIFSENEHTKGDPRVFCRNDCHQDHSYGMSRDHRAYEDDLNDHPMFDMHPSYDDSFSVRPAGFFSNEGRCYYVDGVARQLGGHRLVIPQEPVYDINMAGVSARAYNSRGSGKPFQSFQRSCTRGIPFSLCVEGSDGPVVDTDGEIHDKDIRPGMAVDRFGRYVTLDFEKLTILDGDGSPGATKLHVRLVKPGPNGYQMTYEGPRGSKWYAPYDSLDCVRNCNLFIKENFKEKEFALARQRKYRLDHSEVVDDVRVYYEGTSRLVLDDKGYVIDGQDPTAGGFSEYAFWAGSNDLVSKAKLSPQFFNGDVGRVQIGVNHSIEVNSISLIDGTPTGLNKVTFSNLEDFAGRIVGPLYDHLFVQKLDLIEDLERFVQQRQFLPKQAVKAILRRARRSGKTRWTHFNECFTLKDDWSQVCGPIRTFLKAGGNLQDVDAVRDALDGADDGQIERLLLDARKFRLSVLSDFQPTTGLTFSLVIMKIKFVLDSFLPLVFGEFESVNAMEKERRFTFYPDQPKIHIKDVSGPFCDVSGELDLSIRRKIKPNQSFNSQFGSLHVNG